jgi:hypothetical protein
MAFKKIIDWESIPGHESATAPTSGELGKASTNWTDFTLTNVNGFGGATKVRARYRRQGPDILMRVQFECGATPTASEARVSLPSGLTSSQNIGAGSVSGIAWEVCGRALINAADGDRVVLIEPSKDYVTFGVAKLSSTPTTKATGAQLIGANQTILVDARIPVSGYEI